MALRNVTQNVATARARDETTPEPGRRLLDLVRGKLIIGGSSLNRWCAENGISRHSALACLTGAHIGEDAQKLRGRLLRAAGLEGEGK